MKAVDVELKARATYHDSCSGLRELGIREQPRPLLRSVKGLELVELTDAEVCCGFGGTFSVKYPDISNAIVERKTEQITATGADMLLAGDLGCLMNMAGKLSRQGRNVAVRHVAEVLAGELDQPAICERAITPMQSTSPAFKDNARAALGDVQLQRALASVAPGLAARRGAARAGLPEFEALRDLGRDIKDHTLAHLDLYLEEFERKATEAGSLVHFAPTAEDARAIIREICRDAGARVVTKGNR